MIETSEEWRRWCQSPGAIAVCRSPQWLLDGCPRCGNKTWLVTSDCWAYCKECSKGVPTDYPFTNKVLDDLEEMK
jgi:hypothetical protein